MNCPENKNSGKKNTQDFVVPSCTVQVSRETDELMSASSDSECPLLH